MNIARILYPVRVLGPGERVGLWLCGCRRACKGCSNPELWERRPEYEYEVDQVFMLVKKIASSQKIDGFTVSGGEPLDQPEELSALIGLIRPISEDILIYTGYRIEELRARKDAATDSVLNSAAVLIDGEYIEERNDGSLLRGSSNKRIHFLNGKYGDRYQKYFDGAHNRIQNFTTSDGIISVGIHRPTF